MSTELIENEQSLPLVGNQLPANPWVSLIEKAIEKDSSIETIEKFIKLQREEEDRQAERAFNDSLSLLQSSMPEITKTGKASFKTKNGTMEYDFDKLSDITNALRPILNDCGLSYAWAQAQNGTDITVKCTIKHRSGHSESNQMTAPPDSSGMKNSIQQIASTVTYLQRYTLKAALGIASNDNDGVASAAQEDEGKVKFVRWQATAKKEMNAFTDPQQLFEWYNQAIAYAGGFNKKFVLELEQEYTNIKQQKGW